MKKKYKRVSRYATWLLPGLRIKRWFSLVFIGTILLMLGFAIILDLHPVHFSMQYVTKLAEKSPSIWSGSAIVLFSIVLILFGTRNANSSLVDAIAPNEKDNVLEILYRRRKLNKGPKIVAIGGGTGLSTILKGIKHLTNNITAVVTVGDDGGSSGRLREEMGVLPPGDIRNCIAALANEEDLVTELFQYRFKEGNGLEGHSFGNLFLSALCAITGDLVMAVKESSKVLSIRGRVLPSTLDDMKLIAELEDGRVIQGESNIPKAKGVIKKLKTSPSRLEPLEDVIEAINTADLIILGPGSLYTSIIPNLLVKGIAESIAKSKAKKAYICNVMTQPGETTDYSVSDHIKAICEHAGNRKIIDAVLVNNNLPKNLAKKYGEANSIPVKLDKEIINNMGIEIVLDKLIEESKEGFVRHSPRRLARTLNHWLKTQHFLAVPNKISQIESQIEV